MPVNVKLTKPLTKTVVPDPSPEFGVKEYFLSKCEERLEKKKPEWDAPRFSPATELVVAQRELADADDRLAEKREEQKERRKQLDELWSELRDREQKLRESFIKFNQFVKENQEKRERAERKIEEEKLIQERKEIEIAELKERVEHLFDVKAKMEKHVDEYKIYQEFLTNVVTSTSEFQSIYDILSRYEILIETRAHLAARQVKDLEEMEEARSEMAHLTETKTQAVMGLNNEMAELQTKYDQAKQNSLSWETAVSRIKNTASQKTLELGQVRIACWNLYMQMCLRKGILPSLQAKDIENQLVDIKRTIVDLKKIVRVARQRAAEEGATAQGNVGSANRKTKATIKKKEIAG